MSKNQFFYTKKVPVGNGIASINTEKEQHFQSLRCSFSLDKVIRSEELENGNVLVLLDDIHQRPQDEEVKNHQGKVTSIRRVMNTFQSEIYISLPEDIQRFYEVTSIDDKWTAPSKEYESVLTSETTEIAKG